MIKVDETTMIAVQGKFAKLCVEVDLHKPLVPFVLVKGHLQSVEYEGLH